MISLIIIKVSHIDQGIAEAALVADFTPNLESLLEVGHSIFGFTEQSLSSGHLVQAQRKTTLLTDAPPDCESLLFVAHAFFGLAQHPVRYRHNVQACSL